MPTKSITTPRGDMTVQVPEGFDQIETGRQKQLIADALNKQDALEPEDSEGSLAITDQFMRGLDQPIDNIAAGVEAAGYEETGETIRNVTGNAAETTPSASAKFMESNDGGGTMDFTWGQLPGAVAEQGGQIIGSIMSRAAGAATGGAVAGPGGAAAGALAGPAAFEAMQVVGPVAKERARRNGREQPNSEDWAAATTTAMSSGALNAVGAKYLPGGAKATKKFARDTAKSVAAEGTTEAAQSGIQQTGETAGTKQGADVNLKEALGEGVIAGTAGGTATGAVEGPRAAGRGVEKGAQAAVDRADRKAAQKEVREAEDPADVAADQRVIDLFDSMRSDIQAAKRQDSIQDSDVMNNIKKKLTQGFKDSMKTLRDRNLISQDDFDTLAGSNDSVLSRAAVQKNAVTQSDLDQIDATGLDDSTKQGLKRALQDLDKASKNAFRSNRIGPLESVVKANKFPLILTASGAATPVAGPFGFALGQPTADAIQGSAAAVDKAIGKQEPEVFRRARARRKMGVPVPGAEQNSQQFLDSLQQSAKGRKVETVPPGQKGKGASKKDPDPGKPLQTPGPEQLQRSDSAQVAQESVRLRKARRAQNRPGLNGPDKSLYDQTGLRPKEVDRGLEVLRDQGIIDQEKIDLWNNAPRALMEGNVGNRIFDELDRLAEEGVLQRDPQGPVPPRRESSQSAGEPQSGQFYREKPNPVQNPQSYQASIDQYNQMADEIVAKIEQSKIGTPNDRQRAARGARVIQRTTGKENKREVLQRILSSLSEGVRRPAREILEPLTEQGPEKAPKKSEQKLIEKAKKASGSA